MSRRGPNPEGDAGDDAPGRVRLDLWLWAARFYKTRALAAEAIEYIRRLRRLTYSLVAAYVTPLGRLAARAE